ncbi:MAG: 4Fe-4S binding protein [Leptospirales bacterium]
MMVKVAKGRIRLDHARCNQCGECEELCPTGVLDLSGEGGTGDCILCRYCIVTCPVSALSVYRKGGSGESRSGFSSAFQ